MKTLEELNDMDLDELNKADVRALVKLCGLKRFCGMAVLEHCGTRYAIVDADDEHAQERCIEAAAKRFPERVDERIFTAYCNLPYELLEYLREQGKKELLWRVIEHNEVELVSELDYEEIAALLGGDYAGEFAGYDFYALEEGDGA